jgi:Gly-Xaa carboxypeptidase
MTFSNEKQTGFLPAPNEGPSIEPMQPAARIKRVVCALLATAFIACSGNSYYNKRSGSNGIDQWSHVEPVLQGQCPQVEVLVPTISTPALDLIIPTIESATYKNTSIALLSGAVQIPTVSRDEMGPPGDDEPRWDIFFKFADYLETSFPLIHEHLTREKVNTHGLVYTWKGSDPTLKPTLLLAHQDVVPVPESTIPTWTYPPFSGAFDGTYIWGRGSSDDKNQLIAIMESIELLLTASFVPSRTV